MQAWRGVQEKHIFRWVAIAKNAPASEKQLIRDLPWSNLKISHVAVISLGSIFRQDAMPKLPPSKESCQVREIFFERSRNNGGKKNESFCDVLDLWTLTFFWCCKAGAMWIPRSTRNSKLFTGSVCRQDFIAMPLWWLDCLSKSAVGGLCLGKASSHNEEQVLYVFGSWHCYKCWMQHVRTGWIGLTDLSHCMYIRTFFRESLVNGVVAIPHVESKGITHSFLPRCILSPSLLLWTLPVPGCSLLQYGTNSYIPKGCLCVFRSSSGLKVWAGSKKHTPYLTHRRSLLGQVLHRSKKMWGCSCLFRASKLRKIHSRLNL